MVFKKLKSKESICKIFLKIHKPGNYLQNIEKKKKTKAGTEAPKY